jgi:hypothetical protein
MKDDRADFCHVLLREQPDSRDLVKDWYKKKMG